MVMAGGTGGHVFPAMAVADFLLQKGWSVTWLATEGGMENRLIASKPYQVALIRMSGVRGKGLLRKISAPFQVLKACWQSYRAMRQHRPDVVLGMGGFAAFPGGVVARLLRLPLVIHEQNSVAGLTNRLLAKITRHVLAAFPSAFGGSAQVTGNPVRADITAVAAPDKRFATRTGPLRLLVVGGSLGAQILNEVVPQAVALLPPEQRPQVIHQAGTQHIETLQTNYQKAGVAAETRAFIEDMAAMYDWCDLVICRAGALTVAELAAAGVASILVPFPHAVDDHQTGNARYLADQNAALLLPQQDISPEKMAALMGGLDREKLLGMANRAKALGKPDATAEVAALCEEIAR
jgi:UDP-N-acetylglucosamine--N-acetylmuramyl-(pentapeptide) pyrophosphoryl-undecaprenol N-acetylglucosamine transferase